MAHTSDAGRTWHMSPLPVRDRQHRRDARAVGNDVSAVCLGDPSAGYAPMEVVTSTNGGASWAQRCNNDPLACSGPSALARGSAIRARWSHMADGALVMAVGYPIGGVDVSLDGGRTWKLVLRSAATFLSLSQGAGTVWMLGLGPVSPGLRLAESTTAGDGTRCHCLGSG